VSFHWARVSILLLFLFSFGLAIPLFVGGFEVVSVLTTLPYWTTPLLFLVMLLAWNLNVLRLCVLLDGQFNNVGYWKIMRIYMATEFVSKTTPMGAGAPAAAVSLLAPHGVKPISCLVIFGVSACMDAIVLVCLIGFFAVERLTMTLGANLLTGISLVSVLMLTTIACTSLLLYRHKLLFYLLLRMPGFSLTGEKGKKNAGKLIVSLHRALKRIFELPRWRLLLSWGTCLLYWGLYLSTLYLCIWMLGGGVSWLESGFIQTIAMGIGHLLMIPGGVGGVEVTGTLLLEPKLGATTAATAILLWRFLMLYLYLVIGGVSMLSLGVGAISYGNEKRSNL
jgi:uncharacterized protein (TIRG00374 family)